MTGSTKNVIRWVVPHRKVVNGYYSFERESPSNHYISLEGIVSVKW